MEPLFSAYLELLEDLHTEIEKSLEGLPPEAVDWRPGPGMNSLAVLVIHLTGAERYWIGDVAAGDPSQRVREAEFQVSGLSASALSNRLSGTLAYIHARLEALTLQNLAEPRPAGRGSVETTVGWAILHALEHTALHAGQIQITRQLWDQAQKKGR